MPTVSQALNVMAHSGSVASLVDVGDEILLEDIAVHLGRMPRFVGATSVFLSGIHHALNCEQIAQERGHGYAERATCLSHDFHEAFTGDVPRPLKSRQMKEWQRKLDIMIQRDLMIPAVTSTLVYEIDTIALLTEAYCFGPEGMVEFISPGWEPDPVYIELVETIREEWGDTTGGLSSEPVIDFIGYCNYIFQNAREEVYGKPMKLHDIELS